MRRFTFGCVLIYGLSNLTHMSPLHALHGTYLYMYIIVHSHTRRACRVVFYVRTTRGYTCTCDMHSGCPMCLFACAFLIFISIVVCERVLSGLCVHIQICLWHDSRSVASPALSRLTNTPAPSHAYIKPSSSSHRRRSTTRCKHHQVNNGDDDRRVTCDFCRVSPVTSREASRL